MKSVPTHILAVWQGSSLSVVGGTVIFFYAGGRKEEDSILYVQEERNYYYVLGQTHPPTDGRGTSERDGFLAVCARRRVSLHLCQCRERERERL